MEISFFTVLTTLLWSSLLIALIFLLRKRWRYVGIFQPYSILALYIFCVVRMFFPITPAWTRKIAIPLVNPIYRIMAIDVWQGTRLYILLAGVWIMVAAVLLIRFAYSYRKTQSCLLAPSEIDRSYEEVLKAVADEVG